MAWDQLEAGQTDAGSPVNQTLMDNIKANDDDHETRILAEEAVSTNWSSQLGTLTTATHMGTFTGDLLTSNTSVKALLQEIETDINTKPFNNGELDTRATWFTTSTSFVTIDAGGAQPMDAPLTGVKVEDLIVVSIFVEGLYVTAQTGYLQLLVDDQVVWSYTFTSLVAAAESFHIMKMIKGSSLGSVGSVSVDLQIKHSNGGAEKTYINKRSISAFAI